MTKSNRTIIIAAGVIALLIAGIIVINKADFSKENGELTETNEQSYTVFSADAADLSAVTVQKTDEAIEAVKTDGEWTIYGADKEDIDSSKVYTLISTVSTIISNHKIEENVTDFAQYGLDKPAMTVFINVNGNVNELHIGNKSPTLGEYFIRLTGDSTVYTLYSYKFDTLNQPLSYYSDFDRFSVNIDDITRIKIVRDSETIELKIADNIAETTNNVWEMVKPYETSANDEYIDNNILAAIDALSLNVPVTDGSYGTDTPTASVTLTVKPYDNTTGKYGSEYTEQFNIGKTSNAKTYVSYKDKVYEVDASAVEFANSSSFNILDKLQALVDISRVQSVKVISGSAANTIDVIHRDDDMSFKLNGSNTDYKTARGMYQAMISLAVDGVYKGETLGDTYMEFDFAGIKNEDNVKIEFKSINDLSFALVRNNKAEFTIKKNKVEEFEKLWNEYIREYGGKKNE